MSAPIEVDVAVVGGGPAGLSAATEAARGGAAVALVEPGPIGGPLTMLGWRVLDRAVERLAARHEAGATRDAVWSELARELPSRSAQWRERLALRLEDAGVERVDGRGRFVGPQELEAGTQRVRFDRAVICAGATHVHPEGDSPDGRALVTPEELLQLESIPSEVLVMGGGAAGAELVDALSRMADVTVTWVMDELGILPRFERELAEALGDVLMARGVKLVHGKRVRSVRNAPEQGVMAELDGGRTYAAPLGVLALGRRRLHEGLGLDALGLEQIEVDERMRTALPHVFAAGECTGRCASSAAAEAMGRIAGRSAAGLDVRPFAPARVPRIARTHPEVAQVGLTPERSGGRPVIFRTLRLDETLGGLLDGIGDSADAKGFVRLVCDSATGEVLGASAAGPGAASTACAVAMAIELRAKDSQLADVFGAVPGTLDALLRAAR